MSEQTYRPPIYSREQKLKIRECCRSLDEQDKRRDVILASMESQESDMIKLLNWSSPSKELDQVTTCCFRLEQFGLEVDQAGIALAIAKTRVDHWAKGMSDSTPEMEYMDKFRQLQEAMGDFQERKRVLDEMNVKFNDQVAQLQSLAKWNGKEEDERIKCVEDVRQQYRIMDQAQQMLHHLEIEIAETDEELEEMMLVGARGAGNEADSLGDVDMLENGEMPPSRVPAENTKTSPQLAALKGRQKKPSSMVSNLVRFTLAKKSNQGHHPDCSQPSPYFCNRETCPVAYEKDMIDRKKTPRRHQLQFLRPG